MKRPLLLSVSLVLMVLSVPILTSVTSGQEGSGPTASLETPDQGSIWGHIGNMTDISNEHLAYRVAGSEGAEVAANYISESFASMGLDVRSESFMFTGWDLDRAPSLSLDRDGDPSTIGDRSDLHSFFPEAFSWPTEGAPALKEVVLLPMPSAESYQAMRTATLPLGEWDDIDISGKIVVVAREMRWRSDWESNLIDKLQDQTPAGLVYVWYYDWMGFAEVMSYASSGGVPLGVNSGYLWDIGIPAGSLNASDGRALMEAVQGGDSLLSMNVPSRIGTVPHRNIVAEIDGLDREGKVLVTAHYDSVMTQGLVDNAAGVAAMLEIASNCARAASQGWEPRYELVFVAFAAEEMGMVGSAHFVKAHSGEMSDYVALINLDCIGSSQMAVTTVPTTGGPDLMRIFMDEADRQGVSLQITDGGGSDQDSFRSPSTVGNSVNSYWGADLDLTEVPSMDQAMMVYSLPLSLADGRSGNAPGYIHTPWDGFDENGETWVDPETLWEQTLLVSGVVNALNAEEAKAPSDPIAIYLVVGMVAMAVAAAVLVLRKKGSKEV